MPPAFLLSPRLSFLSYFFSTFLLLPLINFLFSPNVSVGPASLIPTIGGEPAAFKKVDIAILFSDSNPELKRLYKVVQKKNGCIELSQSQDATISLCCQFAAIEVKSPDGSYYGSSVQLAIWLAAGLEKTRRLKELAAASRAAVGSGAEGATEETALPPYVGISVVGHVWNLHLAAKMADGDVVRSTLFEKI